MRPLLLVLALTLQACFADPSCQDACDGASIHRCKWKCPPGGKLDPPSDCERDESDEPCGEARTCVMGVAVNSSEGHPVCVPAPVRSCSPPWRSLCVDESTSASCRGVEGGGGVVDFLVENACAAQPGTVCRSTDAGASCVAP